MYDQNNIFAKIIRGELPCKKVFEDDKVLAFHDLHPSAPVHVLVIPKGEYKSFNDFVVKASDEEVGNFFRKINEIAKLLELVDSGYRLITNHGKDAIQSVQHFHVHILGKRNLGALVSGDSYHS